MVGVRYTFICVLWFRKFEHQLSALEHTSFYSFRFRRDQNQRFKSLANSLDAARKSDLISRFASRSVKVREGGFIALAPFHRGQGFDQGLRPALLANANGFTEFCLGPPHDGIDEARLAAFVSATRLATVTGLLRSAWKRGSITSRWSLPGQSLVPRPII